MGLSKSIRFEVFARDSFTCQYCGRRPPEIVLELEHIHPRSKGGSDELTNLCASCWECNRGKSAKVIGNVAPRPDADLMFLRVQQELAEAERYLKAKSKRDKANRKIIAILDEMWRNSRMGPPPPLHVWRSWVQEFGADEIEASIGICAIRNSINRLDGAQAYMVGILRRRMEMRDDS